MGALTGKVAVVTGSTSGIGLGIARAFAQAGAAVVLNSRKASAESDALVAEIGALNGGKTMFGSADMGVPAEIYAMVEEAAKTFGSVDILVNNAGIQHVAPIDEFPLDKWDQVLATNLSSAFHSTKACLPLMKAAKWGRIINISSAHGLVASPFKSAYVAANTA